MRWETGRLLEDDWPRVGSALSQGRGVRMKISDPLGKVYTHTMFKKKSYNIPKGGEEEYLERGRTQSEEEEDAASDISEASDDSLSTKSSRFEN